MELPPHNGIANTKTCIAERRQHHTSNTEATHYDWSFRRATTLLTPNTHRRATTTPHQQHRNHALWLELPQQKDIACIPQWGAVGVQIKCVGYSSFSQQSRWNAMFCCSHAAHMSGPSSAKPQHYGDRTATFGLWLAHTIVCHMVSRRHALAQYFSSSAHGPP